MIFPALKTPSTFHRLLVSRVNLVALLKCRSISSLSAINKGLRSSRDDAEPKRGGRDRPQRSFPSGDRESSGTFQRSDAPRRPREGGFASAGGDRERPAFKPRNDAKSFSRERPGRPSGSSYAGRTEGFASGGRDRSRPAFKPRDDARGPQDRSRRDFGPSSSNRISKDAPKPQGRLERLRSKESGFAGQPGFSFERKPGSEFASHGRRNSDGVNDSDRGDFSSPSRRSRDDDAPRSRGERSERSFTSGRDSRSFGRSEDKGLSSSHRDGQRGSDSKFERDSGSTERRSRDESYSQGRRDSKSGYERKPASSDRRNNDGPTPRDRDGWPVGGFSGKKPTPARRRERDEASPAENYAPATEEALEQPESEQTERPRKGLLRDIKSACKLIKSIQKAEASGEDTTEMANMTNALLRSVNVHVTSGDFEDDPSEAVASLFQKKASEGTFLLTADKASGRESILFQRSDGKIELAAKRHGFEDHVADVRPERIDSSKGRPAKFPRAEDGDRFDRARPNRDSRGPRFSEDAPEDDGIPISVPYTTAASQFLYGSNAVLAALRGKRRKLYQLYVHPKIFERESGMEADKKSRYAKPAHEFVSLAKEAGIPFRNEFRTHLLDKMSDGRPHNGMVLEASKLPAPPVLGLGKPDARRSIVPLTVAPQSAEDIAVNGDPETISITANSWRHPFVVMLDGITDPGNVGNILRTCHFYGVDAVVVASNTCANLSSAVLAKASSGACEAVRILALPQPSNFVHDSAKAGWKIYAAVAPVATTGRQGKDPKTPEQLTTAAVSSASPLLDHPCILMLGAEGEGLRDNLKNRANAFVSISRGQQLEDSPDVGVDSMNVSVAAGVLLEAFLRKPDGAPEKRDTTGELGF